MTNKHVIRLHAIWQMESGVDRPPIDEQKSAPCERYDRYQRSFGFPTGLATNDQVRLVVRLQAGSGWIWLNEHDLGPVGPSPTALEVRGLLLPRNQIVAELTGLSARSQAHGERTFPGEIWLEIESQPSTA